MRNKAVKSVSITLFALLFVGCSTPTVSNSPKPTTTSNPAGNTTPSTVSVTPGTKITFTQKESGVENPVGPENLSSITVNGVVINASDIKIKSGFSTKAETDSQYQATYEGAGKYTILNKNTSKRLENNAIIMFNLLNSKDPVILPLLQGIFDDNLRLTFDVSTGTFYGGISKPDGTIDDTKPVFKADTDGKINVFDPSGKQTTYDNKNLGASTNLPNPEKTVDISKDDVKKQVDNVKNDVAAEGPIAGYVGLWLYEGLGQKIILSLKDAGKNKFSATATVAGNKYSGEGEYNPTGKNDVLTLKVPQDQMHIEVNKVGDNALQLTLKSTSNEKLKVFQGAPVNLQRVRVTE